MLKKDKNKLGKIAVFGQGNIVSIGLQGFQAQTQLFFRWSWKRLKMDQRREQRCRITDPAVSF